MPANVLSVSGRKAQVDLRINRANAFSLDVYVLGDYLASAVAAQWSLLNGSNVVAFTVGAKTYPVSIPGDTDPVFTKFTLSATAGQVTVTEGNLYKWQISLGGAVVVQGDLDIRPLTADHWRLRDEDGVSFLGEPLIITPVSGGGGGAPIVGDLNMAGSRVTNVHFPLSDKDAINREFLGHLTRPGTKVVYTPNLPDGTAIDGLVLPTAQTIVAEGSIDVTRKPSALDGMQIQPNPAGGAAYAQIATHTPCNQWTIAYMWGPGSTFLGAVGAIPAIYGATPTASITNGCNHVAIGPQGVNLHFFQGPPPLGAFDFHNNFLATQVAGKLYYLTMTLVGEKIIVEAPDGQTWVWGPDIRAAQYWGRAFIAENADGGATDMKPMIAAVIGRWVPAPLYRKQAVQAANITMSGAYQDLVTLQVHTQHDNVTASIVGTICGNVVTTGGSFIDGLLSIDAVNQAGQIVVPDVVGVSTHSQTWVVSLGAAGTHTLILKGRKQNAGVGSSQSLLSNTRLTAQFNDNP